MTVRHLAVPNYTGVAGGPWTPNSIAGCQGWYDASDPASFTYSSGTVVSQWNDKSSNGRHLSQSTVAKQPNRNGTQNGLATVVFDGVDDFIKSASFTQNMPFTLVMAMNVLATGAGHIYFSEGNGWLALYGSAYVGQRDGSANTSGSNWTAGGVHTYVAEYSSSASTIYRDGVSDPFGNALSGSGITTGFCINENGGGYGSYSNMAVFEVIVYNSVLSTTDRQTVENYLKNKWMPWTPATVPNIQGWWDADDASTFTYSSGVFVSQWNDKSGNGFHAVQPVVAQQPTRVVNSINGKAGVQFIYRTIKTTCPGQTIPFSFFALVRIGQYAHDISLNGANVDAEALGCFNIDVSGNKFRLMRRQVEAMSTCISNVSTYSNLLLGVTYPGGASGVVNWYRNGFADGTSGIMDRTFTPTLMCLGNVSGENGGLHPFWGFIGETMKYARVVSAAENTQISNYLMDKWSIPIPQRLPGLKAWYDASDAASFSYSSSTVVSQWNDLSGNGKHLTQGTVANQPNRNVLQNGLTCVAFDGTNDTMSCTGVFSTTVWDTANPHTFIVVSKITGTPASQRSPISANNARPFKQSAGTIAAYAGSILDSGVTWGNTNARLVIIGFHGDTTSFINVDGGTHVTGNVSTFADSKLDVGSYTGTQEFWQGNICEVICMAGKISAPDETMIVNYLKAKWGIT